jgi:hypothetical protein
VPLGEARKPRVLGGWEEKVWVADDFDEPLPPEILGYFAVELPEEER